MRRRPLSRAIRHAVSSRAGGKCEKCGRAERLHVNHIQSVREHGQIDDLDNLSLLCSVCHSEWHLLERTHNVDYASWLAAPPLSDLYQQHVAEVGLVPAEQRASVLHRAHGPKPWGAPPITVNVDERGRRTVNEKGMEAVDLIFRLRREGLVLREIASYLDSAGFKGRRGGAWTGGKVGYVLRRSQTYYNPNNFDDTEQPTIPRKRPVATGQLELFKQEEEEAS